MAAPTESLLRHLRCLAGQTEAELAGDAVLLDQFVRRRDEAAFAALISRHGPLVLGVCRRVLRDMQKAEDVFQATFLVLARKAGALRHPERLSAWLHGTARRLALKCRRADARRSQREAISAQAASAGPDPLEELSARELLGVLDEELQRLPEVYRSPLILCYLEGRTHEEAARLLGCTLGSVRGRVERGRLRLHARLVRRGLTLSAALLSAALAQSRVAAVPANLLHGTVQASRTFAAGIRDGIASEVWTLAQTGIEGTAAKLKMGLFLLLTMGLVTGAAALAYPGRDEKPPETKQAEKPKPSKPETAKETLTDRYGDPLPPGALARLGTVRFRHGDVIEAISLPDDGRTLIAASRDRTVRLWDVATGRELRRLPGHEGQGPPGFGSLRYVAFSPDGKMLATGVSYSRIVRLWDAATGKELRKLQSPERSLLGHIAFSADSKLVAVSADRQCILLWETATGRLVHQLNGGGGRDDFAEPVAFSPDGKMLVSGAQAETLRLWDLKTGKEIRRLLVQPPWPKEKSIRPSLSGLVRAVAFSPDGRILASAAEGAPVRLWDVATGKEIRSLRGDRYGAFALAFSPDGKTLASGDWVGMVRIWETATGKEVRQIKAHIGFVSGVAYIRDGEALVTSGDNAIRLWDARTGAEIVPDRGHTTDIASSILLPDGQTVVTGSSDNTIRWWDLATGKELRRLANLAESAYGMGMVLSPNGAVAAFHKKKSVSEREAQLGIELWDLTARKKLALLWRPNIFAAQFSPDSKTLFTQVSDVNAKRSGYMILSWDVATGKELRVLAKVPSGYGGARLSADGKVFAASTSTLGREKFIYVWETATGKELGRFPGDSHFNQCLAISPNNKLLAVADGMPPQKGGTLPPHYIHLWDIAAGKEVRRFGRSASGYWPVAFSADGRTLATVGEDNRVRLWETITGGERLHLAGHAGRVGDLIFAENDRTLISTSSDTTALVWDLTGLRSPTSAADGKQPSPSLRDLWNALADQDAATAYRAIWTLTAMPRETIAFLRERLRRVESPDEKTIAKLVLDLDSSDFAVRQWASDKLSKMDLLAEPALRKALTGQPSLEMRRRIQQLLEQLVTAPFGAQLQSLRAVELLERIGTADARHVLEELAKGTPGARLTREAKASLSRRSR